MTAASLPVSLREAFFAAGIGQAAGIEDEAAAVARFIGGHLVVKRKAEDAHGEAVRRRRARCCSFSEESMA